MKARSSGSPGWPAMARPRCCCAIFDGARAPTRSRSTAPVALVAGDRQTDGIFPLWSIAENICIRSLRQLLRDGLLVDAQRRGASWPTTGRSGSASARPTCDNNILSLSGGNQQKALFARALGSDARIILMDDPMRGVDIGTKLEVYELIREEAAQRPHLPLVHDRDRRARQLRPRLCVPRRPHRRRARRATS